MSGISGEEGDMEELLALMKDLGFSRLFGGREECEEGKREKKGEREGAIMGYHPPVCEGKSNCESGRQWGGHLRRSGR